MLVIFFSLSTRLRMNKSIRQLKYDQMMGIEDPLLVWSALMAAATLLFNTAGLISIYEIFG